MPTEQQTEDQQATDENASHAHEVQAENEGEKSVQDEQDQVKETGKAEEEGSPKDDAQVSGPVAPIPPAEPSVAVIPTVVVISKKPKTPSRTPAQKAADDAKAAHEKTGKVLEAALLKLAETERAVVFKDGMNAVHLVLLAVDHETRSKFLGTIMDAVDGSKMQTIIDYLDALNSMPMPEKKTE